MKADQHRPNAYQEQARRRVAVRELIEETGNADLLEWVETADLESMSHDAALTFMGEWATQIRNALPGDFDFGCGCAGCTITRGLNFLCSPSPETA